MQVAFTTIVLSQRFGWQTAPERAERLRLYEQVRRLGFAGLEWSPRWFDVDELSAADLRDIQREVTDTGLSVGAINLNRFILTRCPEAAEHRRRLVRSVRNTAVLSAPAVIISLSLPVKENETRPVLPGHTVPEEELRDTAGILKAAAQRAADDGIKLVLELHDDGLLDTPELCLRMRELIGEPNVSLNPDLGNLVRQTVPHASWKDALSQLAPHTGYWHVKNYRDGQPSPIWDGEIDYAAAVSMMQQAGFDGWVSIESYFGDDVMRLQGESLDWLRSVMRKVAR